MGGPGRETGIVPSVKESSWGRFGRKWLCVGTKRDQTAVLGLSIRVQESHFRVLSEPAESLARSMVHLMLLPSVLYPDPLGSQFPSAHPPSQLSNGLSLVRLAAVERGPSLVWAVETGVRQGSQPPVSSQDVCFTARLIFPTIRVL